MMLQLVSDADRSAHTTHHANSCHKPVSIDKPVKSGYVRTAYIKLKCRQFEIVYLLNIERPSAAYLADLADLSECKNSIHFNHAKLLLK